LAFIVSFPPSNKTENGLMILEYDPKKSLRLSSQSSLPIRHRSENYRR